MSQRVSIFDFPVDLVDETEALMQVRQAVEQERYAIQVVTLNPEMLMQGEQNPPLGMILKQAHVVLPDGAGLVWALRRFGHSQAKRLPGIEFSEHLLAYAAQADWRVAVIGASPDVHAAACRQLAKRFVGLNIVYQHHGFAEDWTTVAQACAAVQPQVVLVGLGVPRQEFWLADTLIPLCSFGMVGVGVGGSLDVWSGQKKRAPWIFRAANLEWLYRITSEPWRIQRVSRTLPTFVVKVLTSRQ